ncbi:hypothetical protein GIB67_026014 [Kingdonia uniflora]|uniref:GED domain-containing protein n=1 Tax=Kingdonia uniflora TaxID=39325 RepID=A0A7J7M2Z0_9MAGN|nr:hypothetical protein GIB67_026014 [Kingdonia uniflora]
MDYINTSHPNFIGGGESKAVEKALEQIKRTSIHMSRTKDGLDSDRVPASEKSVKSRTILVRSSANGIVVDQGVRPVADTERLGASGNPSSGNWVSSIFGGSESRTYSRDNSASRTYNEPVHNMEHALSMIQLKKLPTILRPSETCSKQETVEIAVTKFLLQSYYDIVRKNFEDSMPKAIMHFLVNHTERELHNVFIKKLYRENLLEEMLQEPDEVAKKRKHARETLRTLDELPLEVESVEKGYNVGNDPTGLLKIHGLSSSSFYSPSRDYSMPSYATPKNPKSRKSSYSGESNSPLHADTGSNGRL